MAKRDIKQVKSVAKEFGMNSETAGEFGKYIEDYKHAVNRGPADNLSYQKLRDLAKEFLGQ